MRYVEHGSEPVYSDPLGAWPQYSIVGGEIPLEDEKSSRRKRGRRLIENDDEEVLRIIKYIVRSGILQ